MKSPLISLLALLTGLTPAMAGTITGTVAGKGAPEATRW